MPEVASAQPKATVTGSRTVHRAKRNRSSQTCMRYGRKEFFSFALGAALYALVPYTGAIDSVALFVLCYAVIFSMYGGGFATVPAYLRDMFGTRYVGAIHGLLLTAWSMAGIFGPVLVNYIRKYNVTHGVASAQAYNATMYVTAGLLIIGFLCNVFVRSVHERFHMRVVEAKAEVEAAPVFGSQ
jgi:MFS family permease